MASLLVPAYAERARNYAGPMMACGGLTLALSGALAATTSLPLASAAITVVALAGLRGGVSQYREEPSLPAGRISR